MMNSIPTLRTVLKEAPFLWVGHRGDGKNGTSPHLENTMASFEASVDNGAMMLETDCQLTQDGHVVLWHNDRVTQQDVTSLHFKDSAIPEKRYTELMSLDLKNPVMDGHTDQKIMGLDSLLERFGASIYYYLELKISDLYSEEQIQLLCQETIRSVQKSGLLEHTLFVSFKPRVLELCYKESEDLLLGLNIEEETLNIPAPEVPVSVLCPDFAILESRRCKEWDGGLMPYNVNSLESLDVCKSYFCKGVTTDQLELMKEIE